MMLMYVLCISKLHPISQTLFLVFQAFDILENAIRIVDNEISRIKDKLDREAREQTDTAEAVKVSLLLYYVESFLIIRCLS